MANRHEEISGDGVVVVIDAGDDALTLDEWFDLVAAHGDTDIDANAADLVREIREHGER